MLNAVRCCARGRQPPSKLRGLEAKGNKRYIESNMSVHCVGQQKYTSRQHPGCETLPHILDTGPNASRKSGTSPHITPHPLWHFYAPPTIGKTETACVQMDGMKLALNRWSKKQHVPPTPWGTLRRLDSSPSFC